MLSTPCFLQVTQVGNKPYLSFTASSSLPSCPFFYFNRYPLARQAAWQGAGVINIGDEPGSDGDKSRQIEIVIVLGYPKVSLVRICLDAKGNDIT